MQQRLIIPQELKSPTKVSSKLYLSDFMGVSPILCKLQNTM